MSNRTKRKKTKYFDGFIWRNANPDIDLVVSRYNISSALGVEKQFFFPIIPVGEIWIDKRFRREADLLKQVHRLERRFSRWSDNKLRSYIQQKLTRGPRPTRDEIVVDVETITLGNEEVATWYVHGDLVRRRIDPRFIFGGHNLVYRYIRDYACEYCENDNLIWIDALQDPREIIYTRLHEIEEWKRMKWGRMSYARAHNAATLLEWSMRAPERDPEYKPLRMKPYMQSPALCGPASLKIALSFFNKEYTESDLAKLAGSNDFGTDHNSLIKAAVSVGATVFEKASGTIEEIVYFVRRERLPVIVGWWADRGTNPCGESRRPEDDEGHFSVVYYVSDKYIYLMDPASDSGITRLSLKKFLDRWWDLDTPDYVRVERWYMVLNFEGKKFNFNGGLNYLNSPSV
jgi:hypothetical protein